jgi:hypothetical protein
MLIVIVVRCPCGRSFPGLLQRRYRLGSDTLVFDLQFRLRCQGCNRRSGFRIAIFDERTRGDSSKSRLEQTDYSKHPQLKAAVTSRCFFFGRCFSPLV